MNQRKFWFLKNFTCAKWPNSHTVKKALCVCGHHVYKNIWEAVVAETVVYVVEPGNFHDRNTEKDGISIGQLP